MNDRTCVSLFSGIGGMDLGLHRAGFRHLAFCESDAYRRHVLAARWPGVPVYEDVCLVGKPAPRAAADGCSAESEPSGRKAGAGLLGVRDVALLCGGFPCQDLSVAGRRRGLAGSRSGLFHEFARIAESLRPRWLLVENVPGLLSSQGGRDFGTVIGTLADIGYGVAWRILDSRYFGVPQRRRRVFIVGTLAHDNPRAAAERAGEILAVSTRCQGHPATRGETREDVAVASLSGIGTGGPDDNDGQGGRLVSAFLCAGCNVREPFEHRCHAPGSRCSCDMCEGRTCDCAECRDDPFVATSITLASDPISAENLAQPSTKRNGDPGVVQVGASVRRLMPVECERLQALPDQWTDLGGTADSKRYAALGDAVTSSVSEWIGRRLHGA